MGYILTLTFGLIVWIVMWSLGVKSFDAFLITTVLLLAAATGKMLAPLLPGNRD